MDLGLHAGMIWVSTQLPQFAPSHRGPRDQLKPISELALVYAHLTLNSIHPGLSEHIIKWHTFLSSQCRAPGLLERVRVNPDDGLYVLQPYLWLRSTGYRDPLCEAMLRDLAGSARRPTSPGVLDALHQAGLVRREPRWTQLCRKFVLGRWFTDADLDREAYRITHAVFYASRFGYNRIALPPPELRALNALLTRLLRLAQHSRRWDLLIEVLIAKRGVGAADLEVEAEWNHRRAEFAARFNGGVPLSGMAVNDLVGDLAPPAAFAHCYHATLADLLLQSARASRIGDLRSDCGV